MFAPKTVIEGLRGVGRVELELEEGQSAYVFLGQNAVGKTKTLEALFQIALFAYLAKREDRSVVYTANLGGFTEANVSGLSIVLPDRNPSTRFENFVLGPSVQQSLPCVFAGSQNRGFVQHATRKAAALGTVDQRRSAYVSSLLKGMTSSFSSLNMEGDIEHWFVVRAQSANRYQRSDDSREIEIETVLEIMHRIDARVDPAFLEVSGDERVAVKVSGERRQLDQLSSGFASVLKLVQAIVAGYASFTNDRALRDVRGMVFIDEIESHMHLSWQARIVRLLVELFPNTTFFVTTHSALVTAQCRRGEAYRLQRDPDKSVVRSERIDSPGTAAFVDLLDDVFGVDVNTLKIDHSSADDQRQVKTELLEMLRRSDARS